MKLLASTSAGRKKVMNFSEEAGVIQRTAALWELKRSALIAFHNISSYLLFSETGLSSVSCFGLHRAPGKELSEFL